MREETNLGRVSQGKSLRRDVGGVSLSRIFLSLLKENYFFFFFFFTENKRVGKIVEI